MLNQRFEGLYAVLEERKGELLQALAREQEEKLQRVRGLIRQYGDHLEASSKLVESAIQVGSATQVDSARPVGLARQPDQARQWGLARSRGSARSLGLARSLGSAKQLGFARLVGSA